MKNRFSLVTVAALSVLAPVTGAQETRPDFLAGAPHAPAESHSVPRDGTPLGRLVAEALQNNPEIQAAREEWEAARQSVSPAGALDDPMLEAGIVNLPVDSRRFDREGMTMKMIGIAQKFPYPGKRGLRQDMASKNADSMAYGYQEMVNRTVKEVKLAYFDLSLVAESQRLVEKNKTVLEQLLKIAEARYAVGQGSQADVLKAQTQLLKMTDELIQLDRERPMIEAEFNRALGRSTGHLAPPPEAPRLREAALQFDALRETALRDHPQLRALQIAIARNEKAVELAKKDFYPDFDVRFQYGQRDNLSGGIKQEDMATFTVAINLPLWRESKLDPRLAEAAAMRQQAIHRYRARQNEITAQLHHQVVTAEQNLKSARLYDKGILPQARLTVEAGLAAYRVGRIDLMTLLDSQMTVFNYEISHAQALINYDKALAEIDFLIGKPGI